VTIDLKNLKHNVLYKNTADQQLSGQNRIRFGETLSVLDELKKLDVVKENPPFDPENLDNAKKAAKDFSEAVGHNNYFGAIETVFNTIFALVAVKMVFSYTGQVFKYIASNDTTKAFSGYVKDLAKPVQNKAGKQLGTYIAKHGQNSLVGKTVANLNLVKNGLATHLEEKNIADKAKKVLIYALSFPVAVYGLLTLGDENKDDKKISETKENAGADKENNDLNAKDKKETKQADSE